MGRQIFDLALTDSDIAECLYFFAKRFMGGHVIIQSAENRIFLLKVRTFPILPADFAALDFFELLRRFGGGLGNCDDKELASAVDMLKQIVKCGEEILKSRKAK